MPRHHYRFEDTKVGTGRARHPHDPPVIRRSGRERGNFRPMRFVSLHHHSTYSYLDGYALPGAHLKRAGELNMSAVAMTEHGNMDSHVKFEAAAEAQGGVRPIYGCEIYMPVGDDWDGDETRTQRKHHLTILAKDDEGYGNLLKLVTASWRNFYYEPTVTWSDLCTHQKGLLVLSGCQGSLLFCSTVGGKGIEPEAASVRRGLDVARRFRDEFGGAYFVEVQAFPELEETRRFNPLASEIARSVGCRLVATMDCHYTVLEESEVQQILHNLRPGEKRTLEEQAREWGYAAPLCPPVNDNVMVRKLVGTGLSRADAIAAIVSTADIAEECRVTLPRLEIVRYPVDGGPSAREQWRKALKAGWRRRGLARRADRDRYATALRHEMKLIEEKEFLDYFLLVAAGVRWAKENGWVVGPARGSAAASVAAWLLGITEVDPLREEFGGLLRFERFIDVTREDLPDIDLDFPSEARAGLRGFYVSMFGEERVSNVGTFTNFKAKNSLDDIARVYAVPRPDVEVVKDLLIERSSGDLRASSTIEDTIDSFAEAREVFDRYPELRKSALLEGNVKGFGVHAAALVLSNEPISQVTTVAEREVPKGSGRVVQVVALDKYDAERQGLVKMDFLGLNTMSMLQYCIDWLGWDLDRLYGLSLDDEKVYELLSRVDVTGVFQFEGRAQRYVCSMIRPEKFSEIMDCGALCRPGPLHNGAARAYGEVKAGRKTPERIHPALDRIVAPTQHQIVYQEQILQIAREIGNFDAVGVAEIRTIISRKKGEAMFNRRREEFLEGADSVPERLEGVPPMSREQAERVWGDMITSGAYSFNAAHCVSGSSIVSVMSETGDTTVEVAGGTRGGRSKSEWTIRELWERAHGLPMRHGRGGRYPEYIEGPCFVCGEDLGVRSITDWCDRCRKWRNAIFSRGLKILAYDSDGRLRPDNLVDVLNQGVKPVFAVRASGGLEIRGTSDHEVLTAEGWKNIGDLNPGDKLVTNAGPDSRIYRGHNQIGPGGWTGWSRWRLSQPERCSRCGSEGVRLETHHKDRNRKNNKAENLELLCHHCHREVEKRESFDPWKRGWSTAYADVESVDAAGEEEVFDLVMEGPGHNFIANGVVVHNCAAYGLIGYYTAYMKVHHPEVFYAAALRESTKDRDRTRALLRDAAKHDVEVRLPDPRWSEASWRPVKSRGQGQAIRAGYVSIDGVGEKAAERFEAEEFERWSELTRLRGVGPRTVERIEEWLAGEDPFGAFRLEKDIRAVSAEIGSGELCDLPSPTVRAEDLAGRVTNPAIWLGTFVARNVRDLFEVNRARGRELVEGEVKDPELSEWAMLVGEDHTDQLLLKIDRWTWPRMKQAVFGASMGKDLILVQGVRPRSSGTRSLKVRKLWVITP